MVLTQLLNYSPPLEGQGWSLEGQGWSLEGQGWSLEGRGSAILSDAVGRKMKENPLKQGENSFEIDLNDYAQGIYFLNISGYRTLKLLR